MAIAVKRSDAKPWISNSALDRSPATGSVCLRVPQ
jgi:hypothetical protein